MDTFVTPLCCKVFCSFYVWEIFFFQNTLLDFVARISTCPNNGFTRVYYLGFNNTSSHFFFQRREKEGKEGGKLLFVEYKKRREKKKKKRDSQKDSNKKVVCLVPS